MSPQAAECRALLNAQGYRRWQVYDFASGAINVRLGQGLPLVCLYRREGRWRALLPAGQFQPGPEITGDSPASVLEQALDRRLEFCR